MGAQTAEDAESASPLLNQRGLQRRRRSSGVGLVLADPLRRVAAEFLGTFVLILLGQSVVAQKLFSSASSEGCAESEAGSYLAVNLGWGAGVFFGVVVSAGVSGGHINPAVTLALAGFGRFPWARVLPYMLAQYLGAFLATGVVLAEYWDALGNWGRQCCEDAPFVINATSGCNVASVFTTFPQPFLSLGNGFLDQLVGTAMLMLGVFAISDDRQRRPSPPLGPVAAAAAVAWLVVAIGMCFGFNSGYAINPARDLGPRSFLAVFTPVGSAAFTGGANYLWWWVPVVAPLLGGLLGAGVYEAFVGHWVGGHEAAEYDDVGGDANPGASAREQGGVEIARARNAAATPAGQLGCVI